MAYGVQTDGSWLRATLDEIRQEMLDEALIQLGPDADLSPTSPITRFINVIALELSVREQMIEAAYNAGLFDTAQGISLDRVIETYFGLTRLDAVKSTVTLRWSRSSPAPADIVIPVGSQAATESGLVYETIAAATLAAASQSVDVASRAVEGGLAGNVGSNLIVSIVTPIAGIENVTNPSAAVNGADEEEDQDYRDRAQESGAGRGKATRDAIKAALLAVAGVTQARVDENDTNVTDGNGVPGGSVHCVVSGGNDDDIAQAILDTKPVGTNSHGTNASGSATDDSLITETINFTRPTEKFLFIEVNTTGGSADLITEAILRYVGGEDLSGKNYRGLGVGDDVFIAGLISAAWTSPGVKNVQVWFNLITDLITNGGFETYTSPAAAPDNWTSLGGTGVAFAKVTDAALKYRGANAVRITSGAAGANQGLKQTIAGLTDGVQHTLEARGRTGGAAGSKCKVEGYNVTDALSVVSAVGSLSATTYERLRVQFIPAAGKTYEARIYLDAPDAAGRIAYFDEVRSYKEDATGQADITINQNDLARTTEDKVKVTVA